MASYLTRIGDQQILLEAPASSAFAKSDLEVDADPAKAIQAIVETIKLFVAFAGAEIGPVMRRSGAAFELSFGVRADETGMVMISENPGTAQFACKLTFPPAPPAPPARPAGPPRPPGGPPAAGRQGPPPGAPQGPPR